MLKFFLILIFFSFFIPQEILGAEIFGTLKVGESIMNIDKKNNSVLQNNTIINQQKKENKQIENENDKPKTNKENYLNKLPEYFLSIDKNKKNILLRDSQKRIYVIENNLKRHIKTIEEIKKNYKNWKIENVGDEILCQCKNKDFADKNLIKGKDGMIFFVLDKNKKKVLNQKELVEKFCGMRIYKVDDLVLDLFVSV